jgi:hypothetical protein
LEISGIWEIAKGAGIQMNIIIVPTEIILSNIPLAEFKLMISINDREIIRLNI